VNDIERNADVDTATTYKVLVNDEGQYGLLPDFVTTPPGWRATGFTGSEDDCAAHVDEVWTDMRPKSLRDALAADVC
jgi:MbtH protein